MARRSTVQKKTSKPGPKGKLMAFETNHQGPTEGAEAAISQTTPASSRN